MSEAAPATPPPTLEFPELGSISRAIPTVSEETEYAVRRSDLYRIGDAGMLFNAFLGLATTCFGTWLGVQLGLFLNPPGESTEPKLISLALWGTGGITVLFAAVAIFCVVRKGVGIRDIIGRARARESSE